MSSGKLPPEWRPPNPAAESAERLAAIVDAAERAASSVVDDADEQARRHIEEARAVAFRMRTLAERLQALADELDPPAPAERQAPRLRPVDPADPAPSEEASTPRRAGSAGARLLATQMAVSGSSREEIETRLQGDFGIEDTAAILDAILGPGE